MAMEKEKLFSLKEKGQNWEVKGNINDFQDVEKEKETWLSERRERIKNWSVFKS